MRFYYVVFTILFLAFFSFALWFNVSSAIESAGGEVKGVAEENQSGILLDNLPQSDDKPEEELFFPATEEIAVEPELQVRPKADFSPFAGQPAARMFVLDEASGRELLAVEADKIQPIASITKLATALTFLDLNPGWDEYYTVKAGDLVGGARIYIQAGDNIKIRDLFNLSLIASANSATKALVAATGLSEQEFVARMNLKMLALGLANTGFADPIGFSHLNLSSAREVARLAELAFSDRDISATCGQDSYGFSTQAGRAVKAQSTNILLGGEIEGPDVSCGKTGYTVPAGYCFVGRFFQEGQAVISVVLGAGTHFQRFQYSQNIAQWALTSYEWVWE